MNETVGCDLEDKRRGKLLRRQLVVLLRVVLESAFLRDCRPYDPAYARCEDEKVVQQRKVLNEDARWVAGDGVVRGVIQLKLLLLILLKRSSRWRREVDDIFF